MTRRSGSTRPWLRSSSAPADEDPSSTNIEAVAKLERDRRGRASAFDRVIDAVRAWAGSPMFIIVHIALIGTWIGLNVGRDAFDPYPFGLLNVTLAMEAIFLSSFVLMAQDRMRKDADRRDHLNLQVDMLAEQELTAILNVVVAIANHAGIDVKKDLPEIERLSARTDVRKIAATLEREMGGSGKDGTYTEDGNR